MQATDRDTPKTDKFHPPGKWYHNETSGTGLTLITAGLYPWFMHTIYAFI